MKLSIAWLVLVTIGSTGCMHNPKLTPGQNNYQNVMEWNTALADANNGIAKAVIALNQTSPPLIDTASAAHILTAQAKIALDDESLTAILETGPADATVQAATIQALLKDINTQAQAMIHSGGINIANPNSQQQISADVTTILQLASEITTTLTTVGVLK